MTFIAILLIIIIVILLNKKTTSNPIPEYRAPQMPQSNASNIRHDGYYIFKDGSRAMPTPGYGMEFKFIIIFRKNNKAFFNILPGRDLIPQNELFDLFYHIDEVIENDEAKATYKITNGNIKIDFKEDNNNFLFNGVILEDYLYLNFQLKSTGQFDYTTGKHKENIHNASNLRFEFIKVDLNQF